MESAPDLSSVSDRHQPIIHLSGNEMSKICVYNCQSSTLQAWELVDSIYRVNDPNLTFWWRELGVPCAILVYQAGHSMQSQLLDLAFFYQQVIPGLRSAHDHEGMPIH